MSHGEMLMQSLIDQGIKYGRETKSDGRYVMWLEYRGNRMYSAPTDKKEKLGRYGQFALSQSKLLYPILYAYEGLISDVCDNLADCVYYYSLAIEYILKHIYTINDETAKLLIRELTDTIESKEFGG